ncbi:minichromosome maintenance protein [Yamadazyma tenuis]|uniref:Central kinetochore subunit MCM21 n=1 Tax=Candida tenuis (strain ATCC 10573 / BCRC 21748 / CBS 615 / JCM 9827 / NBRC 10315 / NRRL Y-1498 / VKM Y-70) TaxID=590646 RepID=G3B756_CANTC|nr:uncharacterized protein CANTEDRAFT_93875 [Yamadazyma tenuis ATCC 10573]EGV63104.1 hypothetical protein CANTEDRAFT_93875 [Yamadazyma tenuis ATCC 10573]WEJ97081.1 minichromosome maintenance protein [Yamadazyma tenuis]
MDIDGDALTQEINGIENDIDSLKKEIEGLEAELQREKEESKQLNKLVETERVSLQRLKNLEKRKKRPQDQYDENVPPIVQHTYFDESVSDYFNVGKDFEPRIVKRIDINDLTLESAQSARKIIALKENILYENLYRLGGLTAFPLNDNSCLGLRFDRFDSFNKRFLSPNYVILRRETIDSKTKGSVEKWKVFKHTLQQDMVNNMVHGIDPEGFNDKEIAVFAHAIHASLSRALFVSDLMHKLHNMSFADLKSPRASVYGNIKVFDEISADDAMSHINLQFNKDIRHKLQLVIAEGQIKEVSFQLNLVDHFMTQKLNMHNARLIGVKLVDAEFELKRWLIHLLNDGMIQW